MLFTSSNAMKTSPAEASKRPGTCSFVARFPELRLKDDMRLALILSSKGEALIGSREWDRYLLFENGVETVRLLSLSRKGV